MEINPEKKKIIPNKIQFKHNFPIMFYNKEIMSHFYPFLDEKSVGVIKNCLKKTGAKETKKKIKRENLKMILKMKIKMKNMKKENRKKKIKKKMKVINIKEENQK